MDDTRLNKQFEDMVASNLYYFIGRDGLGFASLLYETYQDDAFDWLLHRMSTGEDRKLKETYGYILHLIGRFSDGFSEDFLRQVLDILKEPARYPVRFRVDLARSVLSERPVCREEVVYDLLQEICLCALDTISAKDLKHQVDPNYELRTMYRRREAIKMFDQGKAMISESILESAVSGNNKPSKRFLALGYDGNKMLDIVRILKNIWGIHRAMSFDDNDEIRHPYADHVFSVSKRFSSYLVTDWKKDADGVWHLRRMTFSSSVPPQSEIEWCEADK